MLCEAWRDKYLLALFQICSMRKRFIMFLLNLAIRLSSFNTFTNLAVGRKCVHTPVKPAAFHLP